MWQHSETQIVPYQWLLRAVGAYLDREGATAIQIIEVPRGFSVRYQVGRDPADVRSVELSYESLLEFRTRMEAARPGGRRPEEQPGPYQDFLRALGYELEQHGAYFILVDEVDDDYLITYQYLRPTEGFLPHKHLSVINRDAREDLLQSAYSRRSAPRKSRFGLLKR